MSARAQVAPQGQTRGPEQVEPPPQSRSSQQSRPVGAGSQTPALVVPETQAYVRQTWPGAQSASAKQHPDGGLAGHRHAPLCVTSVPAAFAAHVLVYVVPSHPHTAAPAVHDVGRGVHVPSPPQAPPTPLPGTLHHSLAMQSES